MDQAQLASSLCQRDSADCPHEDVRSQEVAGDPLTAEVGPTGSSSLGQAGSVQLEADGRAPNEGIEQEAASVKDRSTCVARQPQVYDGCNVKALPLSPMVCTLDFGFWKAVGVAKLTRWRLETPEVSVRASLVPLQLSASPEHQPRRAAGTEPNRVYGLGWRLHLDGKSLIDPDVADPASHCSSPETENPQVFGTSNHERQTLQSFETWGVFFNVNSGEEFRNIDRRYFRDRILQLVVNRLIASRIALEWHANKLRSLCETTVANADQNGGRHDSPLSVMEFLLRAGSCELVPSLLQCTSAKRNFFSGTCSFVILSFADLKSSLYYYNVAVPVLRPLAGFQLVLSAPAALAPFSRTLSCGLSASELMAVSQSLLQEYSQGTVGMCGVCVLVRRRPVRNAPNCQGSRQCNGQGDWLAYFFDMCSQGSLDNSRSSPEHPHQETVVDGNGHLRFTNQITIIDEQSILVPLWYLLLYWRAHPRATSFDGLLLRSESAEAIICVVDSPRDNLLGGLSLGSPLHSVLFGLGFLGLNGGSLRIFAFLDGPGFVRNLQRCSKSHDAPPDSSMIQADTGAEPDEIDSVSQMMVVQMPQRETFGLETIAHSKDLRTTCSDSVKPCIDVDDNHARAPSQIRGQRAKEYLPTGSGETTGEGSGSGIDCRAMLLPSFLSGWLRRNTGSSSDTAKSSITFLADLRRHMNPMVSQAESVSLNVQLIQWRILPILDISKIQQLRCLIFGVGTLGCNVIRALIGWGITQFTLVDCGRVALSSPVRQSLYLHSDATWGDGRGMLKVVAAKRRLLDIRPDLLINAVPLDIPMPGHARYIAPRSPSSAGFDNIKSPVGGSSQGAPPIVARTVQTPRSIAMHLPSTIFSEMATAGAGDDGTSLSEKPSREGTERPKEATLDDSLDLLVRLVDAHDVVLLLTDSRESRWLPATIVSSRAYRGNSNVTQLPSLPDPEADADFCLLRDAVGNETTHRAGHGMTLLPPPVKPHITERYERRQSCTGQQNSMPPDEDIEPWERLFSTMPLFSFPVCITVALGFDSFVIMRHGHRDPRSEAVALACYFCNDLAAPVDSLARRPLDEQCTVTRPGISGLASSIAAELIAAVSQHPCAPDVPHSDVDAGACDLNCSCLGATPHTIRGSLGDFRVLLMQTEAFKHCISCSAPIAKAFATRETRMGMLVEALRRAEVLEELSGLTQMKSCYREDEVTIYSEEGDIDLQEETGRAKRSDTAGWDVVEPICQPPS